MKPHSALAEREVDQPWQFIHIPKTGGTSVSCALAQALGQSWRSAQHQPASRLIRASTRFSFAFTRNPYDRMVSYYMFCKATDSLANFIRHVASLGRLQVRPRNYGGYHRQTDYLDVPISFIGRYETLESDFATVCRTIGIIASLGHHNRTNHTHYRDYYDAESRNLVATEYHDDLQRFGYQF